MSLLRLVPESVDSIMKNQLYGLYFMSQFLAANQKNACLSCFIYMNVSAKIQKSGC